MADNDEVVASGSMTQSEARRELAPFALDLTALFNALGDEIQESLERAVEDGDTPEELIARIEQMLGE